jgi:radical SAM superfamily enzyme YgiQ (UPF0313 family)
MTEAMGDRKPVRVGLVQINNSFSGQNYLPYAVGLLQAYVESASPNPGRYVFQEPIYRRMSIGEAVGKLRDVDVVGFSTYVWNGQISLEIARRLKLLHPEVLVVFGGPHVPDDATEFLSLHSFVDVVVHNEGEKTFLEILEEYPNSDFSNTLGVSQVDHNGRFLRSEARPRMRDLDEVPSPFLAGTFDDLMAANPQESWIGLWETNRGCPFKCTFCDWGSATAAKVNRFGGERLEREVDWFAANNVEYIFCCDANFGIQKRDVDLAEYVALVKKNTGYPAALSVQNTKNATERAYQTQKILSDAGLNKGVALSMQSIDETTLNYVKRDNISLETYMELQRRFTEDGVETYSDLILGMPGETYDTFTNGVSELIENGQHNRIQFNNLSILPNAEMGDPAYQRRYGMQTVESRIINIHGERVEFEDDVPEIQELVIATDSMPRADWCRTRAFCWMTAFIYFDKLLQIPTMVVNQLGGVSLRKIVESFCDADERDYPSIASVSELFKRESESIQAGGEEYVFSKQWLGIYWPADEFAFIKLTAEGRLEDFYHEATRLLSGLVGEDIVETVREAVLLNRTLLKQPSEDADVELELEFDLLAFYDLVRKGGEVILDRKPTMVTVRKSEAQSVDLETWCREVVWWGNKKGAYLYGSTTVERQIAGHF